MRQRDAFRTPDPARPSGCPPAAQRRDAPVQRGFWWSHVGRILSRRWETTRLDRVKGLARYPELRWLDHWHVVPVAAYAVAWWAIAGIPGVLFTFGEGWHHNHHHCPSTANQGWFWWEIDLSWYVLLLLAKLGVVWDLRTPPRAIRDGGREAALD